MRSVEDIEAEINELAEQRQQAWRDRAQKISEATPRPISRSWDYEKRVGAITERLAQLYLEKRIAIARSYYGVPVYSC
jgi:hypothetical protein